MKGYEAEVGNSFPNKEKEARERSNSGGEGSAFTGQRLVCVGGGQNSGVCLQGLLCC